MKSALFFFLALFPCLASAFVAQRVPKSFVSQTSLAIGPIQKFTDKGGYEKVVTDLMKTKGYTREQAEKEYNDYLENPTNYALQKGEEYYKGLGYKSVMEGVIGEAEKEGKGDEVRARIEDFKKKSKLKGLATMAFFITLFFYCKIQYPYVPPGTGGM